MNAAVAHTCPAVGLLQAEVPKDTRLSVRLRKDHPARDLRGNFVGNGRERGNERLSQETKDSLYSNPPPQPPKPAHTLT